MNFFDITAVFLIGVLFIKLLVAYYLTYGMVRADFRIVALNERAFVGMTSAVSGVFWGLLGANRLFNWNFQNETALTIISMALFVQALPSFVWLYLYSTNRFKETGEIKPRSESVNGPGDNQ